METQVTRFKKLFNGWRIFSNVRYFTGAMALVISVSSCRSIKPYEKEYLLNPTMDDARVESLSGAYGKSIRPFEKLAASSGSGGSTSCPTCGGK